MFNLCSYFTLYWNLFNLLIWQFGGKGNQAPEGWQVLEVGPSKVYPELHKKTTMVSTGYIKYDCDWFM